MQQQSKCYMCRVTSGWENAGRLGLFYGSVVLFGGQSWSIVCWDDEADPTMFKTAGLEIQRLIWQSGTILHPIERGLEIQKPE